jgi:hypothetical protein
VLWQTQQPVQETLILKHSGEQLFGDDSGQLTPLTGRVARQISELILTFISGDQDTIAQFFDLTSLDSNRAELTPRKRRLKRAINNVNLSLLESTTITGGTPTDATSGLALEIIGKDESSVIIESWSNAIFQNELELLDRCYELNKSLEGFCKALTTDAVTDKQADMQQPSGR